MTNRHIMTEEQVATLELPEGRRLYQRDGIWYAEGDGWGVAAPHVALAKLAAAVANGYLPRAVLDHAIAASRGEEWLPDGVERLKDWQRRAIKLINDDDPCDCDDCWWCTGRRQLLSEVQP